MFDAEAPPNWAKKSMEFTAVLSHGFPAGPSLATATPVTLELLVVTFQIILNVEPPLLWIWMRAECINPTLGAAPTVEMAGVVIVAPPMVMRNVTEARAAIPPKVIALNCKMVPFWVERDAKVRDPKPGPRSEVIAALFEIVTGWGGVREKMFLVKEERLSPLSRTVVGDPVVN